MSTHAGVAGTWTLDSKAPRPERFATTDSTPESLFEPDNRIPVDSHDFVEGGKYRSIVKLQIRYEGQSPEDSRYYMGTGWLISPDILVTAGHNVFHWSSPKGMGRAVHIKCYIGYQGENSLNSRDVQSRIGKSVVVPAEWLASKENRHRDVAFIRVDHPFSGNLRPFSYKPTPKSGNELLGVVGYPGDRALGDVGRGKQEPGAHMYEEFDSTAYSLQAGNSNPLSMLQYQISTFAGQDGSPVISRSGRGLNVIGTHVHAAGDKNQATTIGSDSNDYDSLLKVFSGSLPVIGDHQGIQLVKHKDTGASAVSSSNEGFGPGSNRRAFQSPMPDDDGGEGFLDAFKTVANSVSQPGQGVNRALPFASPLLGPLAAPIAAVAGTALGAIINGPGSFSDEGDVPKGVTERAILAESALQAVVRSDGKISRMILSDIQKTYAAHAPNIQAIAANIAPSLKATALEMTNRTDYIQKNQSARRALEPRPLPDVDEVEPAFGQSDLHDLLLQPARPLEDEPGVFDHLSSLISKGLGFAKPLLKQGAREALHAVGKVVNAESESSSSVDNNSTTVTPEDIKAAEVIVKRALIGDAALTAISKLPAYELVRINILPPPFTSRATNDGDHQESIFDVIMKSAQVIGKVVTDVAPDVLKAVRPFVASLSESSAPPAAAEAPLRKKPNTSSFLDMVNNGTLGGQASFNRF
ncbi:trypsin-like cysteine/serine peptidase domain-containing protein [Apodospora peruviana]|uniref:Serine protease n=1 Tax=Apodospora peruviana TaxID=516989 RepID=A0AAE0HSX6_9PEZI|nr:trypsin-like cysteine/serine peptidase domain-containing protein [Apodospora peruviana]